MIGLILTIIIVMILALNTKEEPRDKIIDGAINLSVLISLSYFVAQITNVNIGGIAFCSVFLIIRALDEHNEHRK